MSVGLFKAHLLLDVVKRIGRVDSETDQDNVGIGVGKRAETVIIFLTSRIPKSEFNVLVINLDIGDVVFEDGGDVDLRKGSVNLMSVRLVRLSRSRLSITREECCSGWHR